MFRSASRRPGASPPFDPRKLEAIARNLSADGAEISMDAESERYLDAMGSEAEYMPLAGEPGVLIFRRNPSRAAVVEELLHLGQIRRRKWQVPTPGELIELEIEAQHRLLRIADRLGWSAAEKTELERALASWKGMLVGISPNP